MYVQEELLKRELEREKRDREFWVSAFGGEVPEDDSQITLDAPAHGAATLPESDDEVIARSMLGRR